jgi:hypothetical protein
MTPAALLSEGCAFVSCHDRRTRRRLDTNITATVREIRRGAEPCPVRDFSPSGCRLHFCDLSPGAEVWIRFSGIAPVRAQVAWAHSGLAGCHFYEPLSPLMLTLAKLRADEDG